MKNLFIVSLFILYPLFNILPQYSKADSSLVKTTFTREFNCGIIDKYLNSGNPREINAALLSIAQSEDTLWVPKIIKLNFSRYGKEICFTLGELGPCSRSSTFLLRIINEKKQKPLLIHEALSEIGKTGGLDSFNQIAEYYTGSKSKNIPGISLAMYAYFTRGIISKNEAVPVIVNEIIKHRFPCQENFEAVFALYSKSAPDTLKFILIDELKRFLSYKNYSNSYASSTVPYLLGCLRKLSYFPEDNNLFNLLINSPEYTTKVEAAHSLIYYKFKNQQELDKYLHLLDDANLNVGRAAAASLKNINLNDALKNYLKTVLLNRLNNHETDLINKDELFISYLKLFPDSFENQRNKFEHLVTKGCFYDACDQFDSSKSALDFLLNNYREDTDNNKINILQSSLDFQTNFPGNARLEQMILGAIGSDFPPLISIAADGIDSVLIKKNLDTLKTIIPIQINKYMNNPDYQESIMSLAKLSKEIDNGFYNTVLNILINSNEYPLKKFIYKMLGRPPLNLRKDAKYFDNFWIYAFKFRKAEIVTNKGKFIIELLPQVAPVSAGNFAFLANKNFFTNGEFHRVVPGFVIQGGDPEKTGWGGPGYDIVSEFSSLNYEAGFVGMASAGKDTEGSQWFVTTGSYPHLNGRYSIFGKIIKGLKVINRVEQKDRILRVKLI
jgi:cyclophilin family peptidyl-prolyl cis-trans isomerase